mmetsp:Transcript_8232/g.15278  ORF Transcript_8232/g.15278 Transcript_8232/m.15278 type:complete len:425 (+) Transcript_8232:386-1660(+)
MRRGGHHSLFLPLLATIIRTHRILPVMVDVSHVWVHRACRLLLLLHLVSVHLMNLGVIIPSAREGLLVTVAPLWIKGSRCWGALHMICLLHVRTRGHLWVPDPDLSLLWHHRGTGRALSLVGRLFLPTATRDPIATLVRPPFHFHSASASALAATHRAAHGRNRARSVVRHASVLLMPAAVGPRMLHSHELRRCWVGVTPWMVRHLVVVVTHPGRVHAIAPHPWGRVHHSSVIGRIPLPVASHRRVSLGSVVTSWPSGVVPIHSRSCVPLVTLMPQPVDIVRIGLCHIARRMLRCYPCRSSETVVAHRRRAPRWIRPECWVLTRYGWNVPRSRAHRIVPKVEHGVTEVAHHPWFVRTVRRGRAEAEQVAVDVLGILILRRAACCWHVTRSVRRCFLLFLSHLLATFGSFLKWNKKQKRKKKKES